MSRQAIVRKERYYEENESDNELNDEIDCFHKERDNLDDTSQIRKPQRNTEILNVEGSSGEDSYDGSSSPESSDEENELEEKRFEDMREKEFEKWGSKRKHYYDTSYVDEDWGGMNEDEVELAEMEEEDATMRQKRLDALLDHLPDTVKEVHIDFDDENESDSDESSNFSFTEKSLIKNEESYDNFLVKNPEYEMMVDEYSEKRKFFSDQLFPVINYILQADTERKTLLGQQLSFAHSAYSRYLLNILYYLRLKTVSSIQRNSKLNQQYLDNHPVLDDIMLLKKVITQVEEFLDKNDIINIVLELLNKGEPASNFLKSTQPINKDLEKVKSKFSAVTRKIGFDEERINVDDDDVRKDLFDESEYREKRGITAEIEKNRGLTARRKKDARHSRVKKRKQFKKALKKKKSQRPDIRDRSVPYGGEARGIRAVTVKSVKLKA